jgi:hypothetical protein
MRCSLPVVSAVPLFELQRCAVRLDKAAANRFRSAAPDNLAPIDCTTAQGGGRCKPKTFLGGLWWRLERGQWLHRGARTSTIERRADDTEVGLVWWAMTQRLLVRAMWVIVAEAIAPLIFPTTMG